MINIDPFKESFIYAKEAFLVDEVLDLDSEAKRVSAIFRPHENMLVARYQRGNPKIHPRHVSAPELVMMTGNLGCLHAYYFYGCKWEEGWVGFGNRIHRADFRSLVHMRSPLYLESKETRTRIGPKRVVLRYEFNFKQDNKLVYYGDQSAFFVLGESFI